MCVRAHVCVRACVRMARCQQTGTVNVLMRDGDKGRPQLQPRAQAGVHGQAEAHRQVGTWPSALTQLHGLR